MTVIFPRDRTFPRTIALHEIAAGDIVRIHFYVGKLQRDGKVTGLVTGEPGCQFRRRVGRGQKRTKYWIDLQRVVGGPPFCICTEVITRVELIAPGPRSLIAQD